MTETRHRTLGIAWLRQRIAGLVALQVFLFAVQGWSANVQAALESVQPGPAKLWFPVGEELFYQLSWGFIHVGQARARTEWVPDGDRLLLRITYRARTNKLFDKIYPVNDFAEAVVDPGPFLPVTFTVKMARRKALTDEVITFDHARRTARWESRLSGKSKEFRIDADARDLMTYMYHLRATGLSPDTSTVCRIVIDDQTYEVNVDTRGVENVRLPLFGTVPCLKVAPHVNFKGLVIESGRVTMWASQDARRVATRLDIEGLLANVTAVLYHIHGPGDDAWTRAMEAQAEAGRGADEAGEGTLDEPVPTGMPPRPGD